MTTRRITSRMRRTTTMALSWRMQTMQKLRSVTRVRMMRMRTTGRKRRMRTLMMMTMKRRTVIHLMKSLSQRKTRIFQSRAMMTQTRTALLEPKTATKWKSGHDVSALFATGLGFPADHRLQISTVVEVAASKKGVSESHVPDPSLHLLVNVTSKCADRVSFIEGPEGMQPWVQT